MPFLSCHREALDIPISTHKLLSKKMPIPDQNTLFSDICLAIEKAKRNSFLSFNDSREAIEQAEAIERLSAIPEVVTAQERRRLDLEARKPAPTPPKPKREIPYDSHHLIRAHCHVQNGDETGVFWAHRGCIGMLLKKATRSDYITGLGRYGDRHSGVPLLGSAASTPDLKFIKIEFEDSVRRRRSVIINGETLLLNSTAKWSDTPRRVQINLAASDFLRGRHRNRRLHEVAIFLPTEEASKLQDLGSRPSNRDKNASCANLWKSFFQASDLFAYLERVHTAVGPIPLEIQTSSTASVVPARLTAIGDELRWLPYKKAFSENDDVEAVRVIAIRPVPTPSKLVSISPHPKIMTFNIGGLVAAGIPPGNYNTWNKLIGAQ